MAIKYKEYFKKMTNDHKEFFESFKKLHDEYGLNENGLQDKFNKEGEKIMDIVREYENRLCSNTERGMYNKFSTNLAEKFQNEVRKHFPLIDHIGLKITSTRAKKDIEDVFTLKKINLL